MAVDIAPDLRNRSAGTFCNWVHPEKQARKVVTLSQPENRSAGMLCTDVLLKALWKLVTAGLPENSPSGISFSPLPWNTMRNVVTAGLLANSSAGTVSNDGELANNELKVVILGLLAKSFAGTVFSLPLEKMIEASVSSVLCEKKSSSIEVRDVPRKRDCTDVSLGQL